MRDREHISSDQGMDISCVRLDICGWSDNGSIVGDTISITNLTLIPY